MHVPSMQVLSAPDTDFDKLPVPKFCTIQDMCAATERMLHQFLGTEDEGYIQRDLEFLRNRLAKPNIRGFLLRTATPRIPGIEALPDNHPHWETHDDVWRSIAGVVTRRAEARRELADDALDDLRSCVVTDLHVDCQYNRIDAIARLLNIVRVARGKMSEAMHWDLLAVRVAADSEHLRERLHEDGFTYIGFHDREYTMAWFPDGVSREESDDIDASQENDY